MRRPFHALATGLLLAVAVSGPALAQKTTATVGINYRF